MLNKKYQSKVAFELGEGVEKRIYFKKGKFISKKDFETILGKLVEEVDYDVVNDAIGQMLHDGEYEKRFVGKTISKEAYKKLSGYDVEQFIYKGLPGFWIEMRR